MSEADTRDQRHDRYESVLECIRANTGGPDEPQRAGVRREQVALHLGVHGQWTTDGALTALRAAVDNDDVVVWTDEEGEPRFTLASERAIRRVIAELNARDAPRTDLIEWCGEILDSADLPARRDPGGWIE